MATFPARHVDLAGTGFHLATVSAAGAMERLLAVISASWASDSYAPAMPVRTLARIESSQTLPRTATLQAISSALEAAGIEFISQNGAGPGARLARRLDDN
ncbi:transcriptional regulator [Mesorhizobium sp. M0292]